MPTNNGFDLLFLFFFTAPGLPLIVFEDGSARRRLLEKASSLPGVVPLESIPLGDETSQPEQISPLGFGTGEFSRLKSRERVV